ncbi:hypothetical protein [Streptomyces sp. A1136]|uniref:hypothetical protein n=1 Tax=Streptomyces sp. A1136 TaxID=2563102 RepID=UPI0019D2875E|nr:hypothetical protein [Streptomyces sp. A1136]
MSLKPGKEGDGRMGALTRGCELLRSEVAAVAASASSTDQVPYRVLMQDFALFGVLL